MKNDWAGHLTMKLNLARAAQLASLATQKLCDQARGQEACAPLLHAMMNACHDFCTVVHFPKVTRLPIASESKTPRGASPTKPTTCQRHVIVGDLKLVTRCDVDGGQSGAKKLMYFLPWAVRHLVQWWFVVNTCVRRQVDVRCSSVHQNIRRRAIT